MARGLDLLDLGKVEDLGVDAEFGLPGDFFFDLSGLFGIEGHLNVAAFAVVGVDTRCLQKVVVEVSVEEIAGFGQWEHGARDAGATVITQPAKANPEAWLPMASRSTTVALTPRFAR